MKSLRFALVTAKVASFLALAGAMANDSQLIERLESKALPNAIRLTEKVISGGQPAGEPAFAELQQLGVKTVISVDGAKPDVEAARKYGLRYVHLPHGYDGIPDDRLAELAKALRKLPGPIYIHCHHGKHRSPAASAAACVTLGDLTNDEALAVLKEAGTSTAYRGLYQTVREARPFDKQSLDNRRVEFREVVEVPPLAEAMVGLERIHDHLRHIADAGWKTTPKHPDLDPAHEALLFREAYTELLRTEEVMRQPKEFVNLLKQSEAKARELETALESGQYSQRALSAIFQRTANDCMSCHQQFRDVPLNEKAGR
jgi:protein tyrosine phosphatase (PTP) superfamily phosphohydrolase (DUF442 family)